MKIISIIFLIILISQNSYGYKLLCNQNYNGIYLNEDIATHQYVIRSTKLLSLNINEEKRTFYMSGPYNFPATYIDRNIYENEDRSNRIYRQEFDWTENHIHFDNFKFNKTGLFFQYKNGPVNILWKCEHID